MSPTKTNHSGEYEDWDTSDIPMIIRVCKYSAADVVCATK